MHADEHDLEAADEEAERQQHVAAVTHRLDHRLDRGLAKRMRAAARAARPGRSASGTISSPTRRSATSAPYQPRFDSSHCVSREHRELSERAGGRGDAERHAALLGREAATEDARHDAERQAGQARADQHAGGEDQHHRRGGVGHRHQPQHVEQRADHDDARGAVLVREHARRTAASRPTSGSARPSRARRSRGPSARSADIGCRNRPKPWRMPIASVSTRPRADEYDGRRAPTRVVMLHRVVLIGREFIGIGPSFFRSHVDLHPIGASASVRCANPVPTAFARAPRSAPTPRHKPMNRKGKRPRFQAWHTACCIAVQRPPWGGPDAPLRGGHARWTILAAR